MNRYRPVTIEVQGHPVALVDGASAAEQLNDIFVRCIYDFAVTRPDPLIIDAGANVGLATLHWLDLVPGAHIECFEPDPDVFAALQRNVGGKPGVVLHQQALWREETTIPFARFGADAGRVAELADDSTTYDAVAVRLSKVLQMHERIDLLKLDIEGAEWFVLDEAREELHRVDALIVEHHSFVGQEQLLSQLFEVLREAGFRTHVHNDNPARQPLLGVPDFGSMDLQLNVFAWRDAG
jgi:FkbM family methyltransferase